MTRLYLPNVTPAYRYHEAVNAIVKETLSRTDLIELFVEPTLREPLDHIVAYFLYTTHLPSPHGEHVASVERIAARIDDEIDNGSLHEVALNSDETHAIVATLCYVARALADVPDECEFDPETKRLDAPNYNIDLAQQPPSYYIATLLSELNIFVYPHIISYDKYDDTVELYN